MLEYRSASSSRWLWIGVVTVVTAICAVAGLGLTLAMAGRFHAVVAIVGGLTLTALAVPAIRSLAPASGSRDRWAIVALVVVVAVSGWHAQHTGEHLVLDRDPGSYQNTARWLERDGGLRVYAPNAVLESVDGVQYRAPAVYDVDDGVLEFQFNHGAAVVYAAGYDVGGPGGLFVMPVLAGGLGLLAIYLCVRPFVANGALAIAALAAFAVSLPYLNTTRDTYSEALVLVMVWAGLAGVLQLWDRRQVPRTAYLLVGGLLGGASLFRVDALIYVAAGCLLAALLRLSISRDAGWVWLALGASLPVGLGAVDALVFAGDYAPSLDSQIKMLVLFTVLCAAAAVVFEVARRGPAARLLATGLPARWATLLAGGVALAFVAAWLVRPVIREPDGNWSAGSPVARLVESLQRYDGDTVDALRSYAELSVVSLAWYLGVVVVALAVVGIFAVVRDALHRPRSAAMLLAAACAIGSPLYLVLPNIAPDHLWMTRRYVPFVIPSVVVVAAIGADQLAGRLARFDRLARVPAAGRSLAVAALAALMFVPALAATWPIRNFAPYRNHLAGFDATCEVIGEGATVLLVGDGSASMPLRSWCGVDVGIVDGTDVAGVVTAAEQLQRAAAETCTRTYLVSRTELPQEITPYITSLWGRTVVSTTNIEWTLDRRPERYRQLPLTFFVGTVLLRADCPSGPAA